MSISNFKAVALDIYPAASATPAAVSFGGQDATSAAAVAGGDAVVKAGQGDQAVPGSYASGAVVLRTYKTLDNAAVDVAAVEGFLKQAEAEKALTADVTNATATMSNLTGLTVNLRAGRTYSFVLTVFCVDSQAAEGLKFDLDGGTATATNLRAHGLLHDTALLLSSQVTALATDFVAATVTGAALLTIRGTITVNAAGTFIPRFSQNTHTSGTATANRGSFLLVKDIG